MEPGLIGGEVNAILARHKVKGGHPVQYKIGPDPSSIDSCMIGGIVSNNSSGMCCGVSQNTYHTLADMRIVFTDGTVLDTADPASVAAFEASHAALLAGVSALAARVQADAQLSALIRRKFAIKCTTGYSLNALVDFPADRPVEIVKRLMIGSEGTFGFVSRATYNTVPEWPHKASAFVMFPDVHAACSAASVLRDQTAVDAVEMFDRPSLRQCEREEAMLGLVPDMKGADPRAAALLIECRGETPAALEERIAEVRRALLGAGLPFGATAAAPKPLDAYEFKHDARDYKVYWDTRKGLIPIVGGAREPGTSMLIEDVACPVDRLADMTVDLADMFHRYGYSDASCFGHALEGNLHLVFAQGFRTPEEVQRFADMMEEMCYIVATKHRGSLKGEHGTGRNVAPFVEMEWGTKVRKMEREGRGERRGGGVWGRLPKRSPTRPPARPPAASRAVLGHGARPGGEGEREEREERGEERVSARRTPDPPTHPPLSHTPSPPSPPALPFSHLPLLSQAYELMWELKALFDPDTVLNPGVVLNRDPDLHVKNLKPSPVASPLVDRCIECGFCESNCPSRDGALTPRQRITSFREISRLQGLVGEGRASPAEATRLADLSAAFEYAGKEMCAADGMCQEKCPVKINTGDLIKELRAGDVAAAPRAAAAASKLADSMGAVTAVVPTFLNAVDLARRVVGAGPLEAVSVALNKWSNRLVPTYNAYMPKGAPALPAGLQEVSAAGPTPAPAKGTVTPKRAVYLPSCVTRMMGPAGSDPLGAAAAPADRLVSLAAKAGWEVVTPDGLSGLCCGMMFGSKGFDAAAKKAADRTIAALEAASEGGRLPIVCDTSPCTATLKAALPAGSPLRFALHEPVGFVTTHLAKGLDFEKVAGKVSMHVPCSSKKMGTTAAFEALVGKCAEEVVPSGVPCCGMAGDRGMRYPVRFSFFLETWGGGGGCTRG